MPAVNIHPSWYEVLKPEFDKPYFNYVRTFLTREKSLGKTIFPPGKLIFNAFDSTPFEDVKVVILGQDPYHRSGQAMGLSFSVPRGVTPPASLKNIYRELADDLNISPPAHGDLSHWAKQGVFLLNAMLTVEMNKPGSHQKIGWQHFTDAVILALSQKRENLVFMLWGNFARSKKTLINRNKHHVLEAVHPSPLAGGKFLGCRHFSACNTLLQNAGREPVNWTLPQ